MKIETKTAPGNAPGMTATKPSFAPGPWTIQALEENFRGYPGWNTYCVRAANNVHLATVGDVDRFYQQQTGANARLIAAAPAMFEALREIASRAEWLMHYADTGATVTHWTDKQGLAEPGSVANHGALKDAYDKARSALALAEGRGQ